jgi:hypothetical protein
MLRDMAGMAEARPIGVVAGADLLVPDAGGEHAVDGAGVDACQVRRWKSNELSAIRLEQ